MKILVYPTDLIIGGSQINAIDLAARTAAVRATSLEQEHCQLDRPRLEGIARATGGQVLDAAALGVVESLARPEVVVEERQHARSLWHWSWLFALMLAAYAAELLLRKRFLLT